MLTISRLILLILTARFYVFSANITLSEEFVFAYVVLLTFSPLIFNISVVDHLFLAIAMLTQIVNIVKNWLLLTLTSLVMLMLSRLYSIVSD